MLKTKLSGYLFALAAFGTWGFLPAYLRLLAPMPPATMLAQRILGCFLVSIALIPLTGRLPALAALKQRKIALKTAGTGAMLGFNWFIFVWLVDQGRFAECSLGYYINPLFNILLGMLVLRERLDRLQKFALVLAVLGLAGLTWVYGFFPWMSLTLTVTFGLYGLLRKTSKTDSLISISGEMLAVLPAAIVYLAVGGFRNGAAPWAGELGFWLILAGNGLMAALPLFWFSEGVKRIPLTSIGFMQYLAPTIMLAWSVFVFNEAFTAGHLASFSLIWAALALYTVSLYRQLRSAR